MSEQYTPTEAEALGWYARGRDEGVPLDPPTDYFGDDEWEQEWARFIAQVRTDAAREALDGAARSIDLTDYPPENGYVSAGAAAAHWLRDHRDRYYPQGGTDGC